MKSAATNIAPIADLQHCRYLAEVQRRIWGNDGIDLLPDHVLIVMAHNGGVVLGAYAADGPAETGGMVGFVVGWLGSQFDPASGRERLKHCSHIAGVLPAWQGRGISVQLKLAQRQAVLDQGLTDHVTWTYDPLYRVNGRLNIHRLGAVCTTYKRNVYGEVADELNAGAPTDRCQVDWFLRSPHVERAIGAERVDEPWQGKTMTVLPVRATPAGFPVPVAAEPACDGAPLAVPLPADIAAIRRSDSALLIEWRFYIRSIFERAFRAGYVLFDCVQLAGKWYYILVQQATDRDESEK